MALLAHTKEGWIIEEAVDAQKLIPRRNPLPIRDGEWRVLFSRSVKGGPIRGPDVVVADEDPFGMLQVHGQVTSTFVSPDIGITYTPFTTSLRKA